MSMKQNLALKVVAFVPSGPTVTVSRPSLTTAVFVNSAQCREASAGMSGVMTPSMLNS
jgi:hypothetical protein